MLPLNGNLFLANEITNSQDFFVEVQIMKRDLKYSVPKTDLMMNLSPQAKIVDRTRLNVNGICALDIFLSQIWHTSFNISHQLFLISYQSSKVRQKHNFYAMRNSCHPLRYQSVYRD